MDPNRDNMFQRQDEKNDVWSIGAILYVLVAGTTTMDNRVNKLYFDFNEPVWHQVSEELHVFLQGALFVEAFDRMNIEQLLNSEFIERTKDKSLETRRIAGSDESGLKIFSLAHSLTELLHFHCRHEVMMRQVLEIFDASEDSMKQYSQDDQPQDSMSKQLQKLCGIFQADRMMQIVQGVNDVTKGKSRVKRMLVKDWHIVVESFFKRFAKASTSSSNNSPVLQIKKLMSSLKLNQKNQKCEVLGTIHELMIKEIRQAKVEDLALNEFFLLLETAIEKAAKQQKKQTKSQRVHRTRK